MELINFISAILGILGVLYGIYQHLYYNQIKFYFFVTRLFNRKKSVKFTIVATAYSDEQNVRDLAKKISEIYPHARKINPSNKSVTFDIGDFISTITIDDFPVGEFGENLSIDCFITTTNYKNAINTLASFIEYANEVKDITKIKEMKFNLQIDYSKVKNPYLSSDLGALKKEYIKELMCVIDTDFISKNTMSEQVVINVNKLNYTTTDATKLYRVAQNFLIV